MTIKKFSLSSNLLLVALLVFGLSISLHSTLAAWVAPTATPPSNNIAGPVNVGSTVQSKTGALNIMGGFSVSVNDLFVDTTASRVGIGTNNPGAKLDVVGASGIRYSGVRKSYSNYSSGAAVEWIKLGTFTQAWGGGQTLVLRYSGGVGYNNNTNQMANAEISFRRSWDGSCTTQCLSGYYFNNGQSIPVMAVKSVQIGGNNSLTNDIYAQVNVYTGNGFWEATMDDGSGFTWALTAATDPGTGSNILAVPFSYAIANNALNIDSTGNVGIGTTNPLGKLAVTGAIQAGVAESNTTDISSWTSLNVNYGLVGPAGYWGIRTDTSHNFNLDVHNGGSPVKALTVLQSGNVGIGTTAPEDKLEVSGTSASAMLWPVIVNNAANPNAAGTGAGVKFRMSSSVDGASKWAGVAGIGESTWSNGVGLAFYTNQSGNSEKMRITAGGNVGIGTAAPDTKLDVGGDIASNTKVGIKYGIGNPNLYNFMSGSGPTPLAFNATWGGFSATQKFIFKTNTGQVVTILDGGNVGIGTTTPLYKLHVYSSSVNVPAIFGNNPSGLGVHGKGSVYGTYGQSDQIGAVGNGVTHGVYGLTTNGIGGYFTSATGYALVTGSGNVGIGTATPLRKLTIAAGTKGLNIITTDYAQGTTGTEFVQYLGANTGSTFGALGVLINGGTSYGNLILQLGGGYVGIGTNAPGAKLDVNGDIRSSGSFYKTGHIKYDLNNDGVINATDTAIVSAFAVGNPSVCTLAECDVAPLVSNKFTPDGVISSADALIFSRMIAGLADGAVAINLPIESQLALLRGQQP